MHPVTDALIGHLRYEEQLRTAATHRLGGDMPPGAQPAVRPGILRTAVGRALVAAGSRLQGRAPQVASPC